jgi:conjugal transfer pilus assembly protein TrbC
VKNWLLLILILYWQLSWAQNHNYPTEQILIFVSFSMPEKSLKEWLIAAHKINANVIVRGLINNSFKTTLNKIYQLSKSTGGGMLLDPIIFKELGVTQIPAVAIVNTNNHKDFNIIYGDVTLDYALQKLREASHV